MLEFGEDLERIVRACRAGGVPLASVVNTLQLNYQVELGRAAKEGARTADLQKQFQGVLNEQVALAKRVYSEESNGEETQEKAGESPGPDGRG